MKKFMEAWIVGCATSRMNLAWAQADYGLAMLLRHEIQAMNSNVKSDEQQQFDSSDGGFHSNISVLRN